MTGWEVFPFAAEGLQVVPLEAPALPESPRAGEDPADYRACARRDEGVWVDEHCGSPCWKRPGRRWC